jgi:DNA-binding transcriptional regulator YbjK
MGLNPRSLCRLLAMPKGVVDPDRRDRIARAAIEVVATAGVDGLTHRAAAEAAGVPLGSTTYHFSSREDLLEAAIEKAKLDWDAFLAEWETGIDRDADLPRTLAGLVVEMTGPKREQAVVEYELYVAALRRPGLQALSDAWDEALTLTLARHTDALTADALTLAVDGLLLRSLIRGVPLRMDEAEAIFRRIAGD